MELTMSINWFFSWLQLYSPASLYALWLFYLFVGWFLMLDLVAKKGLSLLNVSILYFFVYSSLMTLKWGLAHSPNPTHYLLLFRSWNKNGFYIFEGPWKRRRKKTRGGGEEEYATETEYLSTLTLKKKYIFCLCFLFVYPLISCFSAVTKVFHILARSTTPHIVVLISISQFTVRLCIFSHIYLIFE